MDKVVIKQLQIIKCHIINDLSWSLGIQLIPTLILSQSTAIMSGVMMQSML